MVAKSNSLFMILQLVGIFVSEILIFVRFYTVSVNKTLHAHISHHNILFV